MPRNKYEGHRSSYALHEGVWVDGRGVNLQTAISIAALILRDYARGWTYDSDGHRIKMDHNLFRRRLFYLISLCKKHRGGNCNAVAQLVYYVWRHRKLPDNAVPELIGPNARKVARELIARGIAKAVRVRVITPRTTKMPKPVLVARARRRRAARRAR